MTILEAVATALADEPTTITVYNDPQDYAGIGRPHRLVAWLSKCGVPRSLVIG